MRRSRLEDLKNWLDSKQRKPLVLRGARQVGKTWLVREFSKSLGINLVELNFEKNPDNETLFSSNDPEQILKKIGVAMEREIDVSNSLLFLDEIQAAPEILAKLRWFAEDLAELPVIAAGSLLEFTLAKHEFSMPVGRINYMHLEPLSFSEFLLALGKDQLVEYLGQYTLKDEVPEVIHNKLNGLFKEYLIVGGMPAAVSNWKENESLILVNQIHNDLLATYRNDFAKYRGRIPIERLEETMKAIPKHLGNKFVYRSINADVQTESVKQALYLLNMARVSHKVVSCSANGVPLGSEIKEKYFKEIFLDVGLCCTSLGLDLHAIEEVGDVVLVNNGGIAEQITGQLLRTINPFYIEPNLYCWHREEKGSNSEIDYVIQHRNEVIPIEVKAGKTGTLKSLHYFMKAKGFPLAVRINSSFPSIHLVDVKNHLQEKIQYSLLSLPFYLLEQIHRIIDESKSRI